MRRVSAPGSAGSLGQLWAFARYAGRLPGFLRRRVGPDESRRWVEEALARRADNFLLLLEHAVFANAGSPYRSLFRHAGIELGDVTRLVREEGVEAALGRLFDAGVHVTLDELKGRRPIERPGLSLSVGPEDFENPLLGVTITATTGGSRGPRQPVRIDLDLLEYEVAADWLLATAHEGLAGRPVAFWRPILAGVKEPLRFAKRGVPVERWFAHNELSPRRGMGKRYVTTVYTILATRLWGAPIPFPEYTPAAEALKVARWLALKTEQGTPAFLSTPSSSCVRVCLAAREHGLDISGTVFRVGGEPFTEAKARVVAERGCRAIVNYAITEIGRVGIACAAPEALDDVHLATDKLAVIQRDRAVGSNGRSVGAFRFTALHPRARKILINVDTGDYGVLTERDCGCPTGALGFSQHVHTIRSYEKLTSEGVNFIGSDLLRLVEEVLPARFGGSPSEYQLVEQEVDGLPKIEVVVSPRVGDLDEAEVVAAVLRGLGEQGRGEQGMASIWRHGETLLVSRREPHVTGAGKILPLHVLRA